MKDDRKNLHRHIQAAQNWLSLAEKSIEKEDDLQGDLKLMLAKAELKNAEKHQHKNWLKKFLPLTVAIIITCSIFAMKSVTDKIDRLPELSFNTSLPTPASPDETNNQKIDSSDSTIEQSQLNSNVDSDVTDYAHDEIMDHESQSSEESFAEDENLELIYSQEVIDMQEDDDAAYEANFANESDYAQPELTERTERSKEDVLNLSITPEVTTPPEDMQKLMQSAGQILRAE